MCLAALRDTGHSHSNEYCCIETPLRLTIWPPGRDGRRETTQYRFVFFLNCPITKMSVLSVREVVIKATLSEIPRIDARCGTDVAVRVYVR